jgi:hypothetical protein
LIYKFKTPPSIRWSFHSLVSGGLKTPPEKCSEEEANAEANLSKIRLVGENDGRGILMLDAEMAARVYVIPAPLAAANQA